MMFVKLPWYHAMYIKIISSSFINTQLYTVHYKYKHEGKATPLGGSGSYLPPY